jgi:hypothetical protein
MQQDRDTEIAAKSFRHLSDGREGDLFELASKTPRTWRRYVTAESTCVEIADEKGVDLYPVDPETGDPLQVNSATLRTVLNTLIVERDGAVSSAHIAKQALSLAYRLRGHPPADWDRLREFLQGVKRVKGGPRRRAQPLRLVDLDAILGRLDPASARGGRNGLLMSLGWYGAFRSDELVTWRGMHLASRVKGT